MEDVSGCEWGRNAAGGSRRDAPCCVESPRLAARGWAVSRTRPPSPSTHDHFPAGGVVVVVAGFFAAGFAAAFGAAFAGAAA